MGLQEALIFFAQGWYPLPTSIRTVSFNPVDGPFPVDSFHTLPFGRGEQRISIAVVTALGERYPSLGAVTLVDPDGRRGERVRGMGNGATMWSVLAT
jgi:hypothetical protein